MIACLLKCIHYHLIIYIYFFFVYVIMPFVALVFFYI